MFINDVTFKENTANNGAAISCCNESSSACNITLVYTDEDTVSLDGNVNDIGTDGNDVTCIATVGEFQSAASEPVVNISSSGIAAWAWGLIIIAVAFALVVLLAILVAAGVIIKKQREKADYVQVE